MKISDKSIFAIFLVLAVGLFIVVYFVPLKNTNDEINSLEGTNSGLRREISELQVYHDNKDQYLSDSETLKKEIGSIVTSFPSMYREEDYILEDIAMEDACGYFRTKMVSIGEPEVLASIDHESIEKAELEDFHDNIEYMYQKVDYSNSITYTSLKDALTEAFSSPYKLNVESISYTREKDSNVLDGVITLGYYYVTGNGREYEEPYIDEYDAGTDNIFTGGYGYDTFLDTVLQMLEDSANNVNVPADEP